MMRLSVLAAAIFFSLACSADAYRWVRGESSAGFGSDCFVLLCKPNSTPETASAGVCRVADGKTCFIVPEMLYVDDCHKLSPSQYVKKHGPGLAKFQCKFEE